MLMDGPRGTMIQKLHLSEEDFRGKLLKDHIHDLKGNNDILCLTQPDIVKDIHRAFLDSGAEILGTNTFSASAISPGLSCRCKSCRAEIGMRSWVGPAR